MHGEAVSVEWVEVVVEAEQAEEARCIERFEGAVVSKKTGQRDQEWGGGGHKFFLVPPQAPKNSSSLRKPSSPLLVLPPES